MREAEDSEAIVEGDDKDGGVLLDEVFWVVDCEEGERSASVHVEV